MSNLLKFMNSLDGDAAALAAFQKDPKATMERAGLSAAEQQAIRSGDKSALAKLAGIDEGKFQAPVYVSSLTTPS